MTQGKCSDKVMLRQVKHRNNVVEAVNWKLKRLFHPLCGFSTIKMVFATLKGSGVMMRVRFPLHAPNLMLQSSRNILINLTLRSFSTTSY